jgi:hypothetical protein
MTHGEDADEDSAASSDRGRQEDVTDVAFVGLAPALSNSSTNPRQRIKGGRRGHTPTNTAMAPEKIQAGTRKSGGRRREGSSPNAQNQGRKDTNSAGHRSDDDAAHQTDVGDEDDAEGDFDEGSDEGSGDPGTGGSEAEDHQGSVDGGVGYNERRFACQVCKKRFWRKTHLTRHSKAHQGKYEYHCEHCGKAFYRRDQYSVHLRSHTGERPYACAFQGCSKRFTQKGALTRHERIHNRYRLWLSVKSLDSPSLHFFMMPVPAVDSCLVVFL